MSNFNSFYNHLGINKNQPPKCIDHKMNIYPDFINFCCDRHEEDKLVKCTNITSTRHDKYKNSTVIEAFEKSNPGSYILDRYITEPEYFETYMKSTPMKRVEMNRAGLHENAIELVEYKNHFKVMDGNHRVLFAKVVGIPELYATVTVYKDSPQKIKLYEKAKELGFHLKPNSEDRNFTDVYIYSTYKFDTPRNEKIDTFYNVEELSHFLQIFEKVPFIENRGTLLFDLFHRTREKRMEKKFIIFLKNYFQQNHINNVPLHEKFMDRYQQYMYLKQIITEHNRTSTN
ncbi:hypothetical protein [Bacillus sp. 166amftsu]|uniref:hypothetical protein n=1 Tax=Bacillus sp. 166amftsu TaxID=1761753 RepID=UPI0008983161|nr:hypothetical protein [Bacillus sp. 166amftsu]SDZ44764.1 hypothetical protein SAMN04488156_1471 [Bacillus sp. 166amftsu]